jgi:hypothetical protein
LVDYMCRLVGVAYQKVNGDIKISREQF